MCIDHNVKLVHIYIVVAYIQCFYFYCQLDSIIMAGNQISRLPADHLSQMTHIKKIDLRLNRLRLLPTETAKFQSLEHVTHVDIRQNQVNRNKDIFKSHQKKEKKIDFSFFFPPMIKELFGKGK